MEAERKVTVLVADDQALDRLIVENFVKGKLGEIGVSPEILEAGNGVEALQKISDLTRDQLGNLLVITDFRMGGGEKNGDALITKLIELGVLPENIVVSSSDGESSEIRTLIGQGITSIPKPINREQLEEWLQKRIKAMGI